MLAGRDPIGVGLDVLGLVVTGALLVDRLWRKRSQKAVGTLARLSEDAIFYSLFGFFFLYLVFKLFRAP